MKKFFLLFRALAVWAFIIWFVYMFAFGGFSDNASEKQPEWYEGGTLHNSTIAEWKNASPQNKLATCGDFIANLWRNEKLKLPIRNMDDVKLYASKLSDFVDTAVSETTYADTESVSEITAIGVVMMGWAK